MLRFTFCQHAKLGLRLLSTKETTKPNVLVRNALKRLEKTDTLENLTEGVREFVRFFQEFTGVAAAGPVWEALLETRASSGHDRAWLQFPDNLKLNVENLTKGKLKPFALKI